MDLGDGLRACADHTQNDRPRFGGERSDDSRSRTGAHGGEQRSSVASQIAWSAPVRVS